MSIARHHAEWLSLMEISGPFLSMPVLVDTFPQGLDAPDPDHAQQLRAAYEEWADNQGGLTPEVAIHHAWIRFVLTQTLEMPDEVLATGQSIPESIKATLAEHGETIRPDMIVIDPDNKKPQLLLQTYPVAQDLNKVVAGGNWKASPAMRMMELLHSTEIRLGLVTNGEQWLLVQAKRGETTGYISWYAGLWLEERLTLRAFRTLLGVERFFAVPENQTLPALLDASEKDQQEVTDQLGYQVRHAVEILVQAIDRADRDKGQTLLIGVGEDKLYEAALTVMMRLVFLLTAEERGLLLLGDPIYDQYYAISTLRDQLREQAARLTEDVMERGLDAWCRLLATFRAVYGGVQHENLTLPAYGGSLFDPDRFPFLEGRRLETDWQATAADPLPINNRTVLHLLEALQILRVKVPGGGTAEAQRLSFRALDIEQIGHVYEGLLDHWAVRATEPVLGLTGTIHKEPETPLTRLEEALQQGEKALLKLLQEETGRSESALKKAMAVDLDNTQKERLRTACGNDEALVQRVLPFAGLVRDDDYGWPIIIQSGSVYVTAGTTRRATGTHYTPRSLTEPIVQHTLEPLVYSGPAEGHPREEWQLRTAKELLELKVCDMAMGSGAFLVQACRYLSERLVEAWDVTLPPLPDRGRAGEGVLQITPEGQPASGAPNETIIPDNDEERLMLARRLVADRCLYGVDKNHLAVEMGKLSLWLITLDKNRPFTFVDHALRHGDSLIGADEEMFLRWAHTIQNPTMSLFDEMNRQELAEARRKRRELQSFEVRDVRDAEEKARLLAEADAAMARIKLGCDLIVGVQLLEDLSKGEKEAVLARAQEDFTAGREWQEYAATRAIEAAQALPAFHWQFEFPEVFAQGGFSAMIGNPPFLGGRQIPPAFGDDYAHYIRNNFNNASGGADFCVYFFLQAFNKIKTMGYLGLISTNTIAQGDTRESGLDLILKWGGEIYRANPTLSWPGVAAVIVSVVHITKGDFHGEKQLGERKVSFISSLLDDMQALEKPTKLVANRSKSYQGSIILGTGFLLQPEEAESLIQKDSRNANVLFPYLTGRDLNTNPEQMPSRWAINFGELDEDLARQYPDCFSIVEEKVYPERMKKDAKKYPRMVYEWWKYWNWRQELQDAIQPLQRVLVRARVSNTHAMTFVSNDWIYADVIVAFAFEDYSHFAIMQSSLHELWVRQYASTLKGDTRYSPTDVFETFAFPNIKTSIAEVGMTYYQHRQELMLNAQEGLTKTYKRFHNPNEEGDDIFKLRVLHEEMDYAVASAYGWDDLRLDHDFYETPTFTGYTICEKSRREVLTRLLKLNHERHNEEVDLGLIKNNSNQSRKNKKTNSRRKKKPKKNDGQLPLF